MHRFIHLQKIYTIYPGLKLSAVIVHHASMTKVYLQTNQKPLWPRSGHDMIYFVIYRNYICKGCTSIRAKSKNCWYLKIPGIPAVCKSSPYPSGILFLCGGPLMVACHFWCCCFSGSYMWTQMHDMAISIDFNYK